MFYLKKYDEKKQMFYFEEVWAYKSVKGMCTTLSIENLMQLINHPTYPVPIGSFYGVALVNDNLIPNPVKPQSNTFNHAECLDLFTKITSSPEYYYKFRDYLFSLKPINLIVHFSNETYKMNLLKHIEICDKIDTFKHDICNADSTYVTNAADIAQIMYSSHNLITDIRKA